MEHRAYVYSYKGRSESTGQNQIISINNHYLIFIFLRLHPVSASFDTSDPALVKLAEAGSEEFSWSVMDTLAHSGRELLQIVVALSS